MSQEINLADVTLRDGLQNIDINLPTDVKYQVFNRMVNSGIKNIEYTSFVNPKMVPQFSDSKDITTLVLAHENQAVNKKALVPNKKGAEIALDSSVNNIVFVLSASEKHNRSNVNMTISESISELEHIVNMTKKLNANKSVQVDISAAFGYICEEVEIADLFSLIEKIARLKVDNIVLCDTSGIATPKVLKTILPRLSANFPNENFGFHFHDTYGCGIVNILTQIEHGFYTIEATLGGLGGCPFAPGASGNVALEDIIWLFDKEGIETGVDLQSIIDTTRYLDDIFENAVMFPGHVYNANKYTACD